MFGFWFTWMDDRIFVNDTNPLNYYDLDTSLLNKIWSPKNKIDIFHAKKSAAMAGFVFHTTTFSLTGSQESGKWKFDVGDSIRPEITCPMDFQWFPFDTQYCHLVLMTLEPDIRLVNGVSLKSKISHNLLPLDINCTVYIFKENIAKGTTVLRVAKATTFNNYNKLSQSCEQTI